MARLTWSIAIQQSGDNYTSDGTIYRPNDNLEIPKISTQQKRLGADGDKMFVNPSTKSNYDTMTFIWLELTSSDFNNLRAKIIGYMDNGDKVQITDHNSVTYEGYFISCKQVWISGVEDTEDLEVIFERT